MKQTPHQDPRHDVATTMQRVYRRGLTTIAGGNISIRDDTQRTWITPAGLDKGNLNPGDIVCVEPDGSFTGPGRPSSELPLHLHVYGKCPDLRAIIHAHAPALVAFSICHEVPDTAVLPEASAVCGRVGYVPYELTGTDRLGQRSADAFAHGANCVILENHGAVVAGPNLADAFHRLETLETTARIIARARALGAVRHPTGQPPSLVRQEKAGAGQHARRRELCQFIRRAYDRHLMTSLLGGFSVRIDDELSVINPRGADLETQDPSDLMRAGPLHQAIYATHPGINAVIVVAPVNATAFSVTDCPLESRATAESHLLLGDVANLPYNLATSDPQRVAAMLSADRPAALLGNRGALVLGGSVLEAYERLEALEATAEAALIALSLGGVIPMSHRAVAELDDALR